MCGLHLTREAFINRGFYRFQISRFLNYWQHLRCAHFSGLSCLNTPRVMLSRGEQRCPTHTFPVGRAVWLRPCTCWTVNKRGPAVLILRLRGNRHINNYRGRETPTNRLCYDIAKFSAVVKAVGFSFPGGGWWKKVFSPITSRPSQE